MEKKNANGDQWHRLGRTGGGRRADANGGHAQSDDRALSLPRQPLRGGRGQEATKTLVLLSSVTGTQESAQGVWTEAVPRACGQTGGWSWASPGSKVGLQDPESRCRAAPDPGHRSAPPNCREAPGGQRSTLRLQERWCHPG